MASSDVPFKGHVRAVSVLRLERNRSDKKLNNWILDEELLNPLASFIAIEREQLGEKERRGLFEQTGVIANRRNNIVNDVLRDFYRFCHR